MMTSWAGTLNRLYQRGLWVALVALPAFALAAMFARPLPAADENAAKPSPANEAGNGSARSTQETEEQAAARIHAGAILVDGHNDLPWRIRESRGGLLDNWDLRQPQKDFHTDLPRLRTGGIKVQFWSAYVPAETATSGTALRDTLDQIHIIRQLAEHYSDDLRLVGTADEAVEAVSQGKIASVIGVEGGHSIQNSLATLRELHKLGVRYLTLTHSATLDWADAAGDEPRSGGLSPFGEDVVHELNRLGVLVDLSHVSTETMHDALDVCGAPVIFSHSSARAICDHPRNVPDDVLARLPTNGGVVMVNFASFFISPAGGQRAELRAALRK